MYYLHRQSNGWYTVDKNSHLNGVEGEPFESFHSAIYFGRLWQIQQEEQNKGEE